MGDWESITPAKLQQLPPSPEYTSGELRSKLSEQGPNTGTTSDPSEALKRKVRFRDQFTCCLCGNGLVGVTSSGDMLWKKKNGVAKRYPIERSKQEIAGRFLSVHHVIPKEKGGPNEMENLITLCKKCHCEIHGNCK